MEKYQEHKIKKPKGCSPKEDFKILRNIGPFPVHGKIFLT